MTHTELLRQAQEGEVNPLLALVQIKDLIKAATATKDEIEVLAQYEAINYEKTFDLHGYVFTKKEGSRTYDFKHIKEWVDAKEKLKEVEAKYKATALQYAKGISSVTKDGEVLEMPFVTYQKDSISAKPAKLAKK